MLQTIFTAIGVITGVLSLVGVLYGLVYWKSSIDSWRKAYEEEHKKYPPAETCLMVKTMWDFYIMDTLHNRPDLATHGSPFKLTAHAEQLIPESLKTKLKELCLAPMKMEDMVTGWLVVKHLGQPAIELMADEKKISVQEAIAILSTYLESRCNNHHQV